jgi:voltage-gated sodium channel
MAVADDTRMIARLDAQLKRVVESAPFRHVITGVILLNAVILGLLTYPLPDPVRQALDGVDRIIVYIFVGELLLKGAAWRLGFFRSGWNWFDFAVVAVSLAPAGEGFAILRALRVLRLFRLFSVMPEMRAVVEALAKAIPGMGAIMMVLMLIFYVAAVMAAKMFGATHPQFFGDLGASAFTLFQIMTLESWSMGVARPVIEQHPWAWAFFVVFIVLTSFAVLNLFIAVIVDSLQSKHFDQEQAAQDLAHDEREALLVEMQALRADVASLRAALSDQGAGGDGGEASVAKSADRAE